MGKRKPAVAGQFYSGGAECLGDLKQCLPAEAIDVDLPEPIVAGIVPHAGWVFSGNMAGLVFVSIKQTCKEVDTFVIFGAAHRYFDSRAAVYDHGSWLTPLGEIGIDEELAGAIANMDCVEANPDAHRDEHSIEVQIPFVQHLFGAAKIVPIIVPASASAVELGRQIGGIIADSKDKNIICIGSTDLTHYGPGYGFCPAEAGVDGPRWAKEVNDREFIDLALKMEAPKLLERALETGNACGPGAAAAVVAVAAKLGRTKGVLLGHTHSNEVMKAKFGRSSSDSVGYAGIVF
ncbi:MAG: AmmeMemoRadiSam system protein B [Planctomycetota bacterium]|jgi:AmmeMemoRadiSam system protein B